MKINPENTRGFTLIELCLVMVMISILVVTAMPRGRRVADEARAAALRRNLLIIRESISRYQKDNGKYPANLQSLVSEGYLTSIPPDPFEAEGGGWSEKPSSEGAEDVFDVFSASQEKDRQGQLFSTY